MHRPGPSLASQCAASGACVEIDASAVCGPLESQMRQFRRVGSREPRYCVQTRMDVPFVGSEAVAAGHLTAAELRRWYRPIYRGVYVPQRHELSLRDRITGIGLASPAAVI